jgi:hypothetical protein
MFCTVTEVIDGVACPPRIFKDMVKAEKHFKACVRENNAEVTHEGAYSRIAKAGDMSLVLHYDISAT